MNWNIVLFDTFLGALMLGTISIMSQVFTNVPQYYKILAFIWSVPLTFFFFINMASRAGLVHIENFSRHAIIGTLLTTVLAVLTISLSSIISMNNLIYMNFILSILFVIFYFSFKIYEIL
jgi:hypothetical protein